MGRLEGKNVFITGASAGIGEATAREFAKEGSNLILTARRLERLQGLKQELEKQYPSITVTAVELDVRRKSQIDSVVASVPPVDVLVNNAGMVLGVDHLVDVDEDEFDQMIQTNVKGLVFLTKAVLPSMKERQTGHIINLGSIAGKQAYAGGSIYCATKYAVEAITASLRHELVDTPIRVSGICPGLVNTEFSTVRFRGDKDKADNVYTGMQPLVAQDIAELIVFTAGRPPHVNIADMLVFPTAQADAKTVARH
ncbi:hypothetical protein BDB00DRAFT_797820 [Zychaea mexicana]|uniref:uncharacterized protein n=1 Tax=Zychaea mexicana TaxID=64656 RepID=UPI0022FE4329|nr:uncharacterized protein BDB00DRAFT_797820 [Zychaea mexicana]KAI9499012.1 hypothetical protein BDB00DRAFT_797820 [Zychaea mexicana]